MSKKNLVIKSKSGQPLKIFESVDSTPAVKKYIFSGVFTACSTNDHVVVNRNNRVYGEQEVLRHLSYLRENIQTNGFILGELDHPIDRFDTQLKEASHKITDLWYDQASHCVMGKLEILDTPNGEIARKLVESGYPLFVSSRAAGEVDPKTKEVHIEQIFTYDIVCTPGFEEARLQRVDESVATNVKHYLNESLNTAKKDQKVTKKYGVLLEGVCVNEASVEAPAMSDEQKKMMESEIDFESLSKPLLNEDEDAEFKLPEANLDPTSSDTVKEDDNSADGDSDEKKDDDNKEDDSEKKEEKNELTDEEKAERRAKILGIEAIDVNGENSTEEEKEEKRAEIIDVESIPADDDDKNDDSEEDKSDDEEKTDECDGSTDECGDADEKKNDDNPLAVKTQDAGTDTKNAKKVLNDADKKEDIKKQTEKDMDKYQELLSKAKKLNDVKESIVRLYPFSISLSDENFAKFAALQPADKNKVQKFIIECAIFDVKDINEKWATPLLNEKRALKNWLRLASDEYKQLYVEASQEVQDAIEESAKFVSIQTQEEADRFWARTGLKRTDDSVLSRSLNEQYQINENAETGELAETAETARALGYSMDYFKMLEDMYE